MLDEDKVSLRLKLAEETIRRCIGRNGFYASAQMYQKQYWIRDIAHSIESLLTSGFIDIVKRQLEFTIHRQKPSGEVPERITEFPPSITGSIHLFLTLIERNPSLLFREIPCSDGDLLALISVERYCATRPDADFRERHRGAVERIWSHVETRLNAEGLLPDADWRDAMLNYTGKTNLCNQLLLMTTHRLAGRADREKNIRTIVNRVFWDDERGYYIDYPGSRRFDTLSHSLALLEGIVPKKRMEEVIHALQGASTRFGYRNIWPAYEERECGQSPEYYQNSTVWPFIQGYAIAALVKAKRIDLAKEEFQKFTDLPGFNEWYNPSSGRPGGSAWQLWSAAGYIRAHRILASHG
jgi:glycogen debranching enzyme